MKKKPNILLIVITIILLIITCYINLQTKTTNYCYPRDKIVNTIELGAFGSSIIGVIIGFKIALKPNDNYASLGHYLLVISLFYIIVPIIFMAVANKIHEDDVANNEPKECIVWRDVPQ